MTKRRCSISLPPIEEQDSVLCVLEAVKAQTEAIRNIQASKLDSLAELKQSILHKAFTGELTADFAEGRARTEAVT